MTARRPTKLSRWHEWAIYLSFGALLMTGIAWLVLDRWIRVSGAFGPEHHPAEPAMLILHGIAAYAMLILAGALIPVHVKAGWSARLNRLSGLTVALLLAVLGATALGLYYLSAETVRGWTSIAHWVVGLGALPALTIHVISGHRAVKERQRRPAARADR